MLRMVDQERGGCGEVHARTAENMATVREKIAQLKTLERALSDMTAECASGGRRPGCPIIETLFDA